MLLHLPQILRNISLSVDSHLHFIFTIACSRQSTNKKNRLVQTQDEKCSIKKTPWRLWQIMM